MQTCTHAMFVATVVVVLVLSSANGYLYSNRGMRVNSAPVLTPQGTPQGSSTPASQPQAVVVFPSQPQPRPVVSMRPVVSNVPYVAPSPAVVQPVVLPQQGVPQPIILNAPFMAPSLPMVQPVIAPQDSVPQPGTPEGGPLPCSTDSFAVHAVSRGREYHFSWCYQPGVTYTFQEAQDYCQALPSDGNSVGFRAVSIETQDEDSFIRVNINKYLVPYIWTSGRRVGPYQWMWQSAVSSQYSHWSHTGGSGRPQPDNFSGNENCLAVLNNFYHDGIVWHDVPCDVRKYAVCERPQSYSSA